MADTNDLLQQIRKVVREENEPIKNKLDAQGSSIAQINTTLGQVKTLAEATAAGVKDLQETTAKEADLLDFHADVSKKINDHEKRIENLEEETGTHNPHKN